MGIDRDIISAALDPIPSWPLEFCPNVYVFPSVSSTTVWAYPALTLATPWQLFGNWTWAFHIHGCCNGHENGKVISWRDLRFGNIHGYCHLELFGGWIDDFKTQYNCTLDPNTYLCSGGHRFAVVYSEAALPELFTAIHGRTCMYIIHV